MKLLGGLLFLLFSSNVSFAYLPPTKMILERTSENAGTGIYAIEQEVHFQNGLDQLVLRESWVVENDQLLRLTVYGTKDFKDQISMQFLYANGERSYLTKQTQEQRPISAEFEEKFYHLKSAEKLAQVLIDWGIAPVGFLHKKVTAKKADDFKYNSEPWLRLSRTGGVVNYAFGKVTPEGQAEANPGVWIEQDQFVIRKMRLPSQAEFIVENYGQYAKGLNYPKSRTVRWGQNSVNIRLLSVTARDAKWAKQRLSKTTLDIQTKLDGLAQQPAKAVVEEFYTRFR